MVAFAQPKDFCSWETPPTLWNIEEWTHTTEIVYTNILSLRSTAPSTQECSFSAQGSKYFHHCQC